MFSTSYVFRSKRNYNQHLQFAINFFIKYPLKVNPLINLSAINGKIGWYNTFRKHEVMSVSFTNAKLVLTWDSIIINLDECNDIFDKFFLSFCTLNFVMSRDKIQSVLWRVNNMSLLASVEYVVIYSGNNNLGYNSPIKIAEGLINIACILKKNYKNLHIFVSCLLTRDDKKSVNRSLLFAVSCYLKELCITNSITLN